MKVKICSNLETLSQEALNLFLKIAEKAIKENNLFTVAFSGGKTPERFFELIGEKCRKRLDWNRVHIFQVDERTVLPTRQESNYRLLYDGFLSKIKIPEKNIHRINAEKKDLNKVAWEYETEIKSVMKSANKAPRFDLIFLGVGNDGHTASLFSDSSALKEKKRLVIKNYYKKLDFWRVTFTLSLINEAKNIVFLVDGKEKRGIIDEILNKKERELPAAFIQPKKGNLFWLLSKSSV